MKQCPVLHILRIILELYQAGAQRFALPALGRGRQSRPTRKMIRRVKLLEIAAESPASGARFVGWLFAFKNFLFSKAAWS